MNTSQIETTPSEAARGIQSGKSIPPLIVGFACLLFLTILSIIVAMSYRLYEASFYEYSNRLCLDNNAQAAYVIDGDLVEHYTKTLTVDQGYEEFTAKLDALKENINARYFYILFDNGVPGMYTYIYDATHQEDFPGEKYALGSNESVLEYVGADQVLLTGKGFEKAVYYRGDYGELYYAYSPIFNSAGKVVAFVGTDIDIAPLHVQLDSYLQKIFITLFCSSILFVVLYLIIVKRILSKPMARMEQEANALSVSLSTVQSILNHIDTCIFVSDLETDELLFINDRMLSDYGLDQSAFGQVCWKALYPKLTSRCEGCPVKQLRENPGETTAWVTYVEREGRSYRNVDRIIDWVDGKKVHLQSSADITELKRIEAALKERLEHQELMAAISQSFISTEPTRPLVENALQMLGRFLHVQKVVITSIQYETDTIGLVYGWADEAAGFTLKPERTPFQPGNPTYDAFIHRKESQLICSDIETDPGCSLLGRYGVRAFIIAPIVISGRLWGAITLDDCVGSRQWQDSEVQLVKLVGSILSELMIRHEMEEQLTRMSSIVQNFPQCIAYIGEDGRPEYVNDGAANMTGYTKDELMRTDFLGLLSLDQADVSADEHHRGISEQWGSVFQAHLRRKDGEVLDLLITSFTADTLSHGKGMIAMNITERRRLEHELLLTKEAAEQASKAKGEFLSRMSHEMRTPMNAIIGMTNIAKSTADAGKKDYCLDRIDSASKHLLDVINSILDISKIEADKFELYCHEFNLEKMLMNITNVIQFQAEEKEQSLLVHLHHNVPASIIGDELRLSQVITNLLSNAVKFTGNQGAVLVEVEMVRKSGEDLTLQVSVTDTGIGIAKEQQSKLFAFFEQIDGSISRQYGGTGLGLAICKRIVELMGGRIWVESEAGKGSKFIFTVQVKRGSERSAPSLAAGLDKEALRILAVDDSLETREYFTHLFEELGVACDVAAGGREALALLKGNEGTPYNVFFIDWNMPGLNGVEVTKRIRDITGDSAIIIMMSVAEWTEIEKEAKEAGVNSFVPKPLFASSIIDCLNACMGIPAKVERRRGKSGIDLTGRFQGHTILVAEDVEVNREIIASLLEPGGATIDFAENGAMALSLFLEHPDRYSLILMDIQMPQLDGLEVTRRFRALDNPKAKTIPIIAMTANVFREDIEGCLEAGMDDHVGKPLDLEDLIGKLSKYLPAAGTPTRSGNRTGIGRTEGKTGSAAAAKDYVDIEDGLRRLLGNQTLYTKLLSSFQAKTLVTELSKVMDSQDHEKVARISHALKGACANLGLSKLSAIASKIEQQAAAGIHTAALTTVLNETTDATIDAIQSILESGAIVCSTEGIHQKF